jgi:uncharacterized protein (TIGR00255 family)
MTAYGRSTTETDIGQFVVEILSVNKKHLEIHLQMPRLLGGFEAELRKWIGAVVNRGQVTVRITPSFNDRAPLRVVPNLPLAKQLHRAWSEIQKELGVTEPFTLDLLRNEQSLFIIDENPYDIKNFQVELERAVQAALTPFVAMKEREGGVLADELFERAKTIGNMCREIEGRASTAADKMREKLISTLEKLVPGAVDNEERILREVALYADRLDISEELSRLHSHIDQLGDTVKGSGARAGKILEFLLQEMNREINTIGSKAADIEISKRVVQIKTELERIREQVQNVE